MLSRFSHMWDSSHTLIPWLYCLACCQDIHIWIIHFIFCERGCSVWLAVIMFISASIILYSDSLVCIFDLLSRCSYMHHAYHIPDAWLQCMAWCGVYMCITHAILFDRGCNVWLAVIMFIYAALISCSGNVVGQGVVNLDSWSQLKSMILRSL